MFNYKLKNNNNKNNFYNKNYFKIKGFLLKSLLKGLKKNKFQLILKFLKKLIFNYLYLRLEYRYGDNAKIIINFIFEKYIMVIKSFFLNFFFKEKKNLNFYKKFFNFFIKKFLIIFKNKNNFKYKNIFIERKFFIYKKKIFNKNKIQFQLKKNLKKK